MWRLRTKLRMSLIMTKTMLKSIIILSRERAPTTLKTSDNMLQLATGRKEVLTRSSLNWKNNIWLTKPTNLGFRMLSKVKRSPEKLFAVGFLMEQWGGMVEGGRLVTPWWRRSWWGLSGSILLNIMRCWRSRRFRNGLWSCHLNHYSQQAMDGSRSSIWGTRDSLRRCWKSRKGRREWKLKVEDDWLVKRVLFWILNYK